MKLRNKRTGEIGKPAFIGVDYEITILPEDKNKKARYYKTLAELNKEWEDVPEEPKEYWYISDFGYVFNHEINNKSVKSTIEEMKSIGNYFETKEEAEKALKKLKALKRLKDKGFDFVGCFKDNTINYEFVERPLDYDEVEEAEQDLAFLFGGEE